ncbi:MAG TPA: plastocyanin/azurin family copper-binding protein, partial [Candidatus Binatia bacterium]|nr:plastocyanin/azurin family copper-binding protein [Candidatus Binatia bacterium]
AAESEEAGAPEERVRIESSVFNPRELTVQVGTTVIFTNVDAFEHTVTEGTNGEAVDDPIVDERVEQNRTVRVTFDEPGTYEITCEVHPSMQMTITVEG